MDEEKGKINLKMDFDARDVIDILVSEQEQNIENHVKNLEIGLERSKSELEESDKEIEAYKKTFVKEKYEGKFDTFESLFKEVGLNAKIRFEIIDGNDIPGRQRPILTSNPEREYNNNTDKIIVALVICNKDLDRHTVDNSVTFHLESEYDEKLIQLNKVNEEISSRINLVDEQIQGLKTELKGTDRLIRRARAAVTKKAVGQDVEGLLADFRNEYPQIELKKEDINADTNE